jgi:cyclase
MIRAIARLDVKNNYVIKGIHLEGLRKVGDPNEMALRYYEAGVDEIVFMDAVASLYDRNNLFHIIEQAVRKVFVPIVIGGGLRTVEDVSRALDAGADKVIVNTGAVRNILLVTEIARKFGSQCLIGSIEAKREPAGGWQVKVNNGRDSTGLEVVSWARQLVDAGIGELMVTSVDQEGTRNGFDIALVETLQANTLRPIIVSGGYGRPEHIRELFKKVVPSAIAFASVLHYKQASLQELKSVIQQNQNEGQAA